MRLIAIFVIALITEAGKLEAASTSGSDINQDLVLKLEALEQKLTELQDRLEKSQESQQEELQTLLNESTIEKQQQAEQIENLNKVVETLQAKVQTTSREANSLKNQFVTFFTKIASAKNSKKSSASSSMFAGKKEGGQNRKSDTENVDAAAEAISSLFLTNGEEGDDSPVSFTLEINATGGVTYTRWGRSSCEADADVLYTGYAAGKKRLSSYTQAGSEYICLHEDPQWGNVSVANRAHSNIVGVEYQFFDDDPFSLVNVDGPLLNHDMPCTVCHVETRSQQLMIPGRNTCPDGWTEEYGGYLVTSQSAVYGSTYMCVDQAPEAVTGGALSTDPQMVYAVEVDCLGLLCPPYVAGYEISCVICSK